MGKKPRILGSWAAALLALAPVPAGAQVSEAAVKAAYLYKMAAFVTWPAAAFASASSPFRICVMGRDDIARPLTQIATGQKAWGRPVVVSQMAAGSTASQCQILFAGDSAALTGAGPVLTVTDRQGSGHSGVVDFVIEGGHVRFVIHRSEAEARRLQISSKLLSVAAAVVP